MDFDKKEAIKLAINEIKKILLEKKFFIFSTKIEVVENILFLYFDKDSNNYKKYFNAILGGLDDWNVDNTNLISFKNEFYYYTKALNFSNFEEFEKYFNLEWICNKCGGFFIIYKKSVIKEEFKIDKEGNEIDLPLKHELIENEDDVSYICTTCGRIYLKCISNIKEIAIWKE